MSVRGRPALLVLETGEVYEGTAWGRAEQTVGEVVFNTSMTGYQEVLTDPSYAGQLVVMTYPHIGNTGVNPADIESGSVRPAGLIVRDLARRPSNHRSQATLEQYLRRAGLTAIAGVDTRALTRRIRDDGAVMGAIGPGEGSERVAELLAYLRSEPSYGEVDYVRLVTHTSVMRLLAVETPASRGPRPIALERIDRAALPDPGRHVVVMDFGVKYSILRSLVRRGFDVTLVPSFTSAGEILEMTPRGVLLSNGPGDPARLGEIVGQVEGLLGRVPLYGICLGHQLLAMAMGAKTFKLKFGHRGSNQPVLDEATGRVAITSQNHGYAVAPEGLPGNVDLSQRNLNDGTVEGLRHRQIEVLGVQYHPEAGPGPSDAQTFFDEMATSLLEEHR